MDFDLPDMFFDVLLLSVERLLPKALVAIQQAGRSADTENGAKPVHRFEGSVTRDASAARTRPLPRRAYRTSSTPTVDPTTIAECTTVAKADCIDDAAACAPMAEHLAAQHAGGTPPYAFAGSREE